MITDLNSAFSDDFHFEAEVRRLAGLIWPQGKVERSPIIDSHERDAVVETPDIVTIIEATTSRRKEKITEDTKKTHELVKKIRVQGFACRGIIVTLHEPTAEQELVVKKYSGSIHLQSFQQFLSRLFDAAEYLQVRISKRFGSIQNPKDEHFQLGREYYIPIPILNAETDEVFSEKELGIAVSAKSSRFAILADFGSGKSMSLREIFFWLRDEFLQKRHSRFPIYINLRDHAGAKYPDEILERHSRDLGLKDHTQLVKAWRAGFIDLLLDGFDEFATVGWSSAPFKLRQLRRTMLEAVRRLITESPKTVGIVAVGRQHYFDSIREMQDALGLASGFQVLRIDSLSEEVSERIVKKYGGTVVPDWIPPRALLLAYLAAQDFLKDTSGTVSAVVSRGEGWDIVLRMIADREAQQHSAIDGEAVLLFLERLASVARCSSDGLGSFSEEDLSAAFQETCGFAPDDAARVLISRLPALASVAPESGRRRFIDPDIADAGRAGDIFRYIASPFDPAVQNALKDAQHAIGRHGLDRLCHMADVRKPHAAKLEVAAESAYKAGIQIAALDILQLMMELNLDYRRSAITILDVEFESMSFDEEIPNFSQVTFQECIINNLFLGENAPSARLPKFDKCLIGSLDGIATLGDLPKDAFYSCDVLELSNSTARNADILETDLPVATKVLLTVLNKLFIQAGRGRKENALYRGLDPRSRGLVPQILGIVEGAGFASPNRIRNQMIWLPKRDKGGRVHEIMSHPNTSTDSLALRIRNL